MRITAKQHQAIKKYFVEVFEKGKIYLFGSRVDDAAKGGDIDLYVMTPNKEDLLRKKITFLAKLKREIGEQKIDLLFDRGLDRAIDEKAKSQGILL